MTLLTKIALLRDIILDTPRNKSDISFYYPIDTLLEIMIDLMSTKTDNENFNDYVLKNPVDKIRRALDRISEETPEGSNMTQEEYRDHVYKLLQDAAKWSYESFRKGG